MSTHLHITVLEEEPQGYKGRRSCAVIQLRRVDCAVLDCSVQLSPGQAIEYVLLCTDVLEI